MTPEMLRVTMKIHSDEAKEARIGAEQNKAALKEVMSKKEFFLKKKDDQSKKVKDLFGDSVK